MNRDELFLVAIASAYLVGRRDATTDYAIWKDGAQYVGALSRPLRDVLAKDEAETVAELYKRVVAHQRAAIVVGKCIVEFALDASLSP